MDIEQISQRVARLDLNDPEAAHSEEDEIHEDVLRYIAEFCTDEHCRALAQAALKTTALDFSRWSA